MNGAILQKLRNARKLTQDEMAEAMHVTKRAYVSWERGERDVSTDTLCRMADYFNVSTDYLLGRVPFDIKKEAPPEEKPNGVEYVTITVPKSAPVQDQRAALESLVHELVKKELDRQRGKP